MVAANSEENEALIWRQQKNALKLRRHFTLVVSVFGGECGRLSLLAALAPMPLGKSKTESREEKRKINEGMGKRRRQGWENGQEKKERKKRWKNGKSENGRERRRGKMKNNEVEDKTKKNNRRKWDKDVQRCKNIAIKKQEDGKMMTRRKSPHQVLRWLPWACRQVSQLSAQVTRRSRPFPDIITPRL